MKQIFKHPIFDKNMRYVLAHQGGITTYSDSDQCLADAEKLFLPDIRIREESGRETSISLNSLRNRTTHEEGWKHPLYLLFEPLKI